MIGSNSKCMLCTLEKPLRKSHILPRSFLRHLKRDTNQLLEVGIYSGKKPRKINFNPTELMLCNECEQLLDLNYEKYGAIYLRRRKNLSHRKSSLLLNNYVFETFYLYFISILWRASKTSLDFFKNVDISAYEQAMRQCLLANTHIVNADFSLEHLIQVRLTRLVSNDIPQDVFDRMFINFAGHTTDDYHECSCVMDGYHVLFFFPFNSRTMKNSLRGTLRRRATLRIPKVNYHLIESVDTALINAAKLSTQFPII